MIIIIEGLSFATNENDLAYSANAQALLLILCYYIEEDSIYFLKK